MKDPRKVIITHMLTEKYAQMKEKQNVYVFEIDTDANKIDVKAAVESLFNVKVEKVRTVNMRGKMKRLGRFTGKRPNWKKAIVNLAEGESITQLDAV